MSALGGPPSSNAAVLTPVQGVSVDYVDLIDRFVTNDDEEAFALLNRHHQSVVRGIVREARDDADDLEQEVWGLVWKYRKTFQRRSQFGTWVYRIADNYLKSYLRKSRRHQHLSIDDEGNRWIADTLRGHDQTAEDRHLTKELIRRTLASMSPAQRNVAYLCYVRGYSLEETAKALRISVSTAKSRLQEARRALARRRARLDEGR
jgi:RNA polymerase sigma-70 factor (ECF subfamily)